MEPMKPMKPMEPMKPMSGGEAWWPKDLGQPATSGAQNGVRYAFFPDASRLLLEENGEIATYDSGDHRISGVSQQDGASKSLDFVSQDGTVAIRALKKLG